MTSPNDRRYSAAHVWVQQQDDKSLTFGITEHAQTALGTIENAELPAPGQQIEANLPCGSLESLKTVSDLIAPLNAEVVEHNPALADDPAIINDDPYGDGWLLRLQGHSAEMYHSLLDADAYEAMFD